MSTTDFKLCQKNFKLLSLLQYHVNPQLFSCSQGNHLGYVHILHLDCPKQGQGDLNAKVCRHLQGLGHPKNGVLHLKLIIVRPEGTLYQHGVNLTQQDLTQPSKHFDILPAQSQGWKTPATLHCLRVKKFILPQP